MEQGQVRLSLVRGMPGKAWMGVLISYSKPTIAIADPCSLKRWHKIQLSLPTKVCPPPIEGWHYQHKIQCVGTLKDSEFLLLQELRRLRSCSLGKSQAASKQLPYIPLSTHYKVNLDSTEELKSEICRWGYS